MYIYVCIYIYIYIYIYSAFKNVSQSLVEWIPCVHIGIGESSNFLFLENNYVRQLSIEYFVLDLSNLCRMPLPEVKISIIICLVRRTR